MTARRTWDVVVGGLAVVAVVVAVVAVSGSLVGGDGESVVHVPPRGQVLAARVGGDPVFVVHDRDGTVRVVEAVSPHDPGGRRHVLAWCRSARIFEDLWYGSSFTPFGSYRGGPSPTGLATRPVLRRLPLDRIEVGEPGPPPDRGPVPGDPMTDPLLGPRCDERTALYGAGNPVDPDVLDDLVLHDPTGLDPDLIVPTPARVLGSAPRDG